MKKYSSVIGFKGGKNHKSTGFHPEELKKANIIVLKKSIYDGYSAPKSYTRITLLSILSKAFETVIALSRSACAKLNDLLPPKQMGTRRQRFTETASETVIEAVHIVWDCDRDNIASLLSLVVGEAFDNVSHQRLGHGLRKEGTFQKKPLMDSRNSLHTNSYASVAVYLIVFSFIQNFSNLRAFLQYPKCIVVTDNHGFFNKQHCRLGHQNFVIVRGNTARSDDCPHLRYHGNAK